MEKPLYDCGSCPGYCCAYPVIQTTVRDVRRIARHLGLAEAAARSEYTELDSPRVRRMKLTADPLLRTESCVFLDKSSRECTIYEARPEICRDHPGDRCEWHDRMLIERAANGGRKVIMLKVLPWTIDADYPLYGEERVTDLLQSYARGDGVIPEPEAG